MPPTTHQVVGRPLLAALALVAAGAEQYLVFEQECCSAQPQPAARALTSAVLQHPVSAAVVSGQRVWSFGGMSGSDTSSVFADLWMYAVGDGTWLELSPAGLRPRARRGAPMAAFSNQLAVLWGGSQSTGSTAAPLSPETTQTVFMLDLHRSLPRWQIVTVLTTPVAVATTGVTSDGSPPAERERHTATLVKLPFVPGDPDGMVVFGGQDATGVGLSDVHALHFNADATQPEGRWYSLSPSGETPPPRLGHSACAAFENLIVFGGVNPLALTQRMYSDVHILSLRGNRWSAPVLVGTDEPPGREGHAMLYVAGTATVFVFGGVNAAGDILSDLWSFSVYSAVAGQLAWTRPIAMSDAPQPRWGATALASASSALLMGGLSTGHAPLSDVWSLRPGCGGNLTLSAARGSFGDGSHQYPSNVDCRWLIQPAVANANVRVSFSSLHILDPADRVLLFDGSDVLAPRLNGNGYTGEMLPPSTTSTGMSMLVQFTSDGSDVSGGFEAVYEAVCRPGFTFSEYSNDCEPCPIGSYAAGPDSPWCLCSPHSLPPSPYLHMPPAPIR